MSEKIIFTLVFLLFFGNIFYVLLSINKDDKPEQVNINYQISPQETKEINIIPDIKESEQSLGQNIDTEDNLSEQKTLDGKSVAWLDINNPKDDTAPFYGDIEKATNDNSVMDVENVPFPPQKTITYDHQDCSDIEYDYNSIKDQAFPAIDSWKRLSANDPQKIIVGRSLSVLLDAGIEIEDKYNDCLIATKKKNDLIKRYTDSWNSYFRQGQWDDAIREYSKILDVDLDSYQAYYNIGSAYLNKWDLEQSLEYYQHARGSARGKIQIQEVSRSIDTLKNNIQDKKSMLSDDTFSHLQYYLSDLNVPAAWGKVYNHKEVVVAVIDDGININHPDLTDHIWVEPGLAYGSNKIMNFVWDEIPDNFPTGKHGTMISGIIAATANNQQWIAGIARDVKIMPLRVFDFKWIARESSIVNAMYYAIHHKANIINLSLGQSQFAYSNEYDAIMKLAYDNGVVVIVAGGNGDVLSYKESWVNTGINPVSPVCNNGGNKSYSIGVGSLTLDWSQARWSNYGACVPISAPGENIFSTSISVFNKEYGVDYDTDSGTSFSAPMVAGIVALGFNQFGYVPPDIVFDSLKESLRLNKSGNDIVDASLYIDTLNKKKNSILQAQKNISSRNTAAQWIPSEKELSLLSNADYLATLGYIEQKNTLDDYMLLGNPLRQEIVALAMKLSDVYVPQDYVCRDIFADVSIQKPNSWACRIIESAYDRGIVISHGRFFWPEDSLTLVEAVDMLLRASNIKIQQYSGGEFEPWQTNVIGTAFSLGLVDGSFNFSTTRKAVRRDVFSIARKIIQLRK